MMVCFMAKDVDIDVFREVLNELHPLLKFIVVEIKTSHEQKCYTLAQVLNFWDVSIIFHQNGPLETDIFKRETNSHDHLNSFSHHPEHIKKNIQNLAERIIVFYIWWDKDKWKAIWIKNGVVFT